MKNVKEDYNYSARNSAQKCSTETSGQNNI